MTKKNLSNGIANDGGEYSNKTRSQNDPRDACPLTTARLLQVATVKIEG